MITLLDTGPLVALLDVRDQHHDWATTELGCLPGPFVTREAVIAETSQLLIAHSTAFWRVLAMMRDGSLEVAQHLPKESLPLENLLRRYAPRMDFADACMVRLSELHPQARLATLDSDFSFYRRHGRERIPLLAPFAK
jgi:predicted nucleic acid-binding protein